MDKVDQRIDDVKTQMDTYHGYDIYRTSIYADTPEVFTPDKAHSNGFKLSLQGKTTEDGLFLYERLIDLLDETQTAYKLATWLRFKHHHPEQSKKAMTIYVRDDWDVKDFAEEVYKRIIDYKGWEDISTPTSYEHYAGAVYFRNDRDENGEYIIAN